MASYLILSDYPEYDDREKNLKDNHGKYFWHLFLSQNKVTRDVAVEFLYNSLDDMKRGNSRWHGIQAKHKPTTILALGANVTKAIGVEGKLNKIRGSVFTEEKRRGDMYIIPTFHPRDLKCPYRVFAEESIQKGLFTSGDIARSLSVWKDGWNQPAENFNVAPTLQDLRDFVKEAKKNQWLLGCDLEGTGLNIENNEIVTMGFAWSESDAICVPLLKEHGEPYWPPHDQAEVKCLIEELFRNNTFIFQNGFGYDVPFLRRQGWNFPIDNYTDETMVLHHTLSPELPHNIGFISSQYGKQPYWKESFLSRKEHIFETDQIEMRVYNLRDCVALHQIRNGMFEHLDQLVESDDIYKDMYNVYDTGMDQTRVLVDMMETGVKKDPKKLKEWQTFSQGHLKTYYDQMMELIEVPEGFSFSADQDVRLLIYGERPPKLDKDGWKEELQTYRDDAFNYQYACVTCGRKITKKFYTSQEVPEQISGKCGTCKTIVDAKRTEKERTSVKGKDQSSDNYKKLCYLELLEGVQPLYKLKGYEPLLTNSGQSALDKQAIIRYLTQITLRLDKLNNMKRVRDMHIVEKAGLEKTMEFLVAYQKWGAYAKLVSTYSDFHTFKDGRIRTTFMPTGTATGRLSSKGPNL